MCQTMFATSVVNQRNILADQLWYWCHWCFFVLYHYSAVCFLWHPHNGNPVTLPRGSKFLHLYEFMYRVVPKNCAQRRCTFLLLGTEELTHILHDFVTGHLTITHWLIVYGSEFWPIRKSYNQSIQLNHSGHTWDKDTYIWIHVRYH